MTTLTPAEIAAMRDVQRKVFPASEWCTDPHGREHSEKGPAYYAVEAERNKLPIVLVDTLNCDSCLTLDEQRAIATFIATFNPEAVGKLLDMAEREAKLRETNANLRAAFRANMLKAGATSEDIDAALAGTETA